MDGNSPNSGGHDDQFDLELESVLDEIYPKSDSQPSQAGPRSESTLDVRPANFQSFTGSSRPSVDGGNMALLMDVSMPLSVQLGTARMTVREILALGPGSVVELNKAAGEPVGLFVNGKLIAHGEVVVIDENFGVRIVEIVSGSNEDGK